MLHALAEHWLQLVFAPRLAAVRNVYAKLMGKPQKDTDKGTMQHNPVRLKAEADQTQCELHDKWASLGRRKGSVVW